MTAWYQYRLATGEIIGVIQTADASIDPSSYSSDQGVVRSDDARPGDAKTRYINAGAVTPRPAMPCSLDTSAITANGTSKATLSGIPAGAAAVVEDVNGRSAYTITDSLIEITSDVAGAIRVTLSLWPYLDARFTVTAA